MGAFVFVGGGEAATQGDVDVVEGDHGPGIAADFSVVAGVAVDDDVGGLGQQRADFGALSAVVADCLVVFEAKDFALLKAEVVVRGEDDAGHAGDGKDVRTVARKLGADVLLCALDQGDDHDDGGYAHDYADERKNGAHLVGEERLQREF